MREKVVIPAIVGILILGLVGFSFNQNASAVSGIVSDGPSCVAIGGTWNGISTCTVSSITVGPGTLLIRPGITLETTGTVTVVNLATGIRVEGTLVNKGDITTDTTSTVGGNSGIFVETGGTLNNSGTITILLHDPSSTGVNIYAGGILNNFDTITISNPRGIGLINSGTLNNYGTVIVANTGGHSGLFNFNFGNFFNQCGGLITKTGTGTIVGNAIIEILCVPNLSSPADGSTVSEPRPDLTWNANGETRPVTYSANLEDTANPGVPIELVSLSLVSVEPLNDLSNGNYDWFVTSALDASYSPDYPFISNPVNSAISSFEVLFLVPEVSIQVDWNLSAEVMPVPPYGSVDIPGSDDASSLIVTQSGSGTLTLQAEMRGLTPNSSYTVFVSRGYVPFTGWQGLYPGTSTFIFVTDSGGAADWQAQVTPVDGFSEMSVWINTNTSSTLLISDNFAIPLVDSDGDGVQDSSDNCLANPNADQSDIDGDGLGDVCDTDKDGDSYNSDTDCNDSDPTINPGATEIPGDGIDQNCDGVDPPAAPTEVILEADKDSFLRKGAKNTNEGENTILMVQKAGNKRTVISFDLSDHEGMEATSATLRLYVTYNGGNWGKQNDRMIDVHKLLSDWTEGNGANFIPKNLDEDDEPEKNRGTGSGVTWACSTDSNISNKKSDCNPKWNGGNFDGAITDSEIISSTTSGWIEFDVTDDVNSVIAQRQDAFGWLIKKSNEESSGRVAFASSEHADMSIRPQLILSGLHPQTTPPPGF